MKQKTLSATGGYARAKDTSSAIAQISAPHRRVQLPPNLTSAVLSKPGAKSLASDAHSTNVPLLGQVIHWIQTYPHDRLMKEREVLTIIGRSKAAMRRDVALGLFPAQIKTGCKSSAWRASEVMGWVEVTTILSRVPNPGFDMKDFITALGAPFNVSAEVVA
ncbi:Predicted transcriptional regulator [Burkholderia pseudomallei]|nr:Predicted transcriptional regulator [Burkholderia pseudomallei]